MKKTVFYTVLVLIVLMFLTEQSSLGIFPYIVTSFLMYQSLFQKKSRTTVISVIAILMGLLNFVLIFTDTLAFIDVIVWMSILGTFGIDKNSAHTQIKDTGGKKICQKN